MHKLELNAAKMNKAIRQLDFTIVVLLFSSFALFFGEMACPTQNDIIFILLFIFGQNGLKGQKS